MATAASHATRKPPGCPFGALIKAAYGISNDCDLAMQVVAHMEIVGAKFRSRKRNLA
jgi:hypothetical protein